MLHRRHVESQLWFERLEPSSGSRASCTGDREGVGRAHWHRASRQKVRYILNESGKILITTSTSTLCVIYCMYSVCTRVLHRDTGHGSTTQGAMVFKALVSIAGIQPHGVHVYVNRVSVAQANGTNLHANHSSRRAVPLGRSADDERDAHIGRRERAVGALASTAEAGFLFGRNERVLAERDGDVVPQPRAHLGQGRIRTEETCRVKFMAVLMSIGLDPDPTAMGTGVCVGSWAWL